MFRLIRILLMLGVLFTGHSVDPAMIADIMSKIQQSKTRQADLARLHFSQAQPNEPQANRPAFTNSNSSIHFQHPPTKDAAGSG